MTEYSLQEIQKNRFKVLRLVYELSGHSQSTMIAINEIENKTGLSHREVENIINYLGGEKLIGSYTIDTTSITHKGIIEVEKALSKPEIPTEYFPAINIFLDKDKTSSNKGITIALISLIGVIITAVLGFLGTQYQTQAPILATQSAIAQTVIFTQTSISNPSTIIVSETPSPEPTPTIHLKTNIPKNQWCIFIVPEDKEMTIRSVSVQFLQEGQLAEDFRENIYEATSGSVWYDVWYEDLWDFRPLPKDKLEDGTIVTARVALGFVNSIEDCVNNGGKIYERPPSQ